MYDVPRRLHDLPRQLIGRPAGRPGRCLLLVGIPAGRGGPAASAMVTPAAATDARLPRAPLSTARLATALSARHGIAWPRHLAIRAWQRP
jgi:hypothetical protein